MSEQKVQQLLVLAVKSVKAGDKDKGRQAFLAALKLDPDNETAWMGLVSVAKDNRERLTALKKVLTMNPNNVRARAVLDKLGIPLERLVGDVASDATPPSSEPETTFDDDDDDEDDLHDRFSAFEDATFGDAPEQRTVPRAFVTDALSSPTPEPEVDPIPEPQSERSVFELPPPMLGTEVGVPVADPQALGRITEEVDQLVASYMVDDYQLDNIEWVRKTKRRAGERDIWKWRAQVFSLVSLALILFVGVPIMVFLSTPEGQAAVFAPTHTNTATPTFTPSHTPGITPTPSSVPRATFTPTPTFFLSGIEGRLRLETSPTPTNVYSPRGLLVSANILDAWDLIRSEEYREAFELLEAEKPAEIAYPYPYYLQAQIDLLANDDPEEARAKLQEGEDLLETIPSDEAEGFVPMYELGFGEILLYEALQAQSEGRTNDANRLFNEAEARFMTAIELDGRITTAYVNLAHLYVAQEEYSDAINMLNIPIEGELSNEFYTDILLRVERGRVYFAEGVYDRALQEANEALFYEPWSEEAYILQAESALAMNRPGVANDFLDGYQLVYPGSLLAYKLEGDAYQMEGKADQALRAYNIALQDNEDKPEYLTVLEARADLYNSQRRYDLAQASYTEYLDRRDVPNIRAKRMLSAYNNQDYEVALDDAEELEGQGVVSDGDLALLQGQIWVDTADSSNDYDTALQQLNEAIINLGVSEDGRPRAEEYLARANFALGNFDQALAHIDRALFSAETGSRQYLKGQILEALDDYESARESYEFVIAWGQIYPYPFLDDAHERYDAVLELINNPPEPDDA